MRFATVCTLAFAICGKANRDKVAVVSKETTEDLEQHFRQETNFEDHLSTTSLCSRVLRLAVIIALGSAVTPADAFAPGNVQPLGVRPVQKDSNIAFAPILTNNPLDGTHDMLRPVNANDIRLYANRQGEEAKAQTALKPLEHPTPADVEAFLEHPTPLDAYLFSRLTRQMESRSVLKFFEGTLNPKTAVFNVLEAHPYPQGNVPEWLSDRLLPKEKDALWRYANMDADIINQIARGADKAEFEQCTSTKKDMLPWVKFLNAGLNKMPSAAPGRLYRVVGFDATGTPGSIAPITGFSSFSEDLNVAMCFVEEKRVDCLQPTVFVMDKHSSGRQLKQLGGVFAPLLKEVVFRAGTRFVIEENEKVQREVEALWRESSDLKEEAVPDFKVLVVKEVLSDEA